MRKLLDIHIGDVVEGRDCRTGKFGTVEDEGLGIRDKNERRVLVNEDLFDLKEAVLTFLTSLVVRIMS